MAPHNPNSLMDSSIGLSVRDWPESEQPRGRLLNCGPDSLSDAELLAIFLRVGVKGMTVMDLSRFLLKKFQGLRGLFKASHQELQAVSGLGPAKVATLKALAAVTVRYLAEEMQRGPFIGHSRDVQRLLCGRFRDRDREVFAVVFLGHQAPRPGPGGDVPGHPQQRHRVSAGNRQEGPAVERRGHGGRSQPSIGQSLAQRRTIAR